MFAYCTVVSLHASIYAKKRFLFAAGVFFVMEMSVRSRPQKNATILDIRIDVIFRTVFVRFSFIFRHKGLLIQGRFRI